jgi:FtsP/CotA-like multicopper oxidase with cupredoxin domain
MLSAAIIVRGGTYVFTPGADSASRPPFEAVESGALPQIRSVGGVLETTLVAAPLRSTIGGVAFDGAAYNGVYGGPVLRLHAGDLLLIHLVNHMTGSMAGPINLHFHGLRVAPTGRGDNMHIEVPPGAHFDYVIRIPRSHPPGLFWYHDHALAAAEQHVTAGLSGALIIDGFERQFTGLHDTPQNLMVLKDWSAPDCIDPALKAALHCRVVSINGAADWAGAMRPNGTALWRLSNQGANLTLHLAVPGLELRVIGRDGTPATDGAVSDRVDIMPASRVDVLVRAPHSGTYSLAAIGVPTGRGGSFSVQRILGTVTVRGAPAHPMPALAFPAMADLRGAGVQARRRIVFGENKDATVYTINGRTFDPLRIDLKVPLGSVEEWTVVNDTPDFHEFHIHQLGFQLTEINHAQQAFAGFVDDVRVPEHGEVKLLIPFTDPVMVGHVMFHCHVLNHEDRGMMATLEIFRPGFLHICRVPNL